MKKQLYHEKQTMDKDLIKTIQDFSVFSSFSSEKIEEILTFAKIIHSSKNNFIFREEEEAKGMYILIKGLVKICHESYDGKEVVLHVVRNGGIFGESSFWPSSPNPASAFALEESKILFFPQKQLEESVLKHSDWALALLLQTTLRLRMFTRKLEARGRKDIAQRLAAYILHRSRLENDKLVIKLTISREVLGGILGTSRESVSRALTRLVDSGCLKVKGKEIHILDVEALSQMTK